MTREFTDEQVAQVKKALNLSPKMCDALHFFHMHPSGDVVCYSNHKSTIKALIKRGGVKVEGFPYGVKLDLALTIAAAVLYDESSGLFPFYSLEKELQSEEGYFTGWNIVCSQECWKRYRQGRLTVAEHEVKTSNSALSIHGWVFKAVQSEGEAQAA